MSSSWHSYSSIYAVGHRALRALLNGETQLVAEEKVDGSQFAFGRFGDELRVRSKSQEFPIDAPPQMFNHAAATVKALGPALHDGWTYRGEYLQKPKHNTLAYDRVPDGHIILFDIETAECEFLDPVATLDEATRIGLQAVPMLWSGAGDTLTPVVLHELLDRTSVLGGQKIEGIVIKPLNRDRFDQDKKVLMGKFVSEAFKEVHRGAWRTANPTRSDILDRLIETYRTPARWQKALQHLREAGVIEGTPRDIGRLIHEVPADLLKECREEITAALFTHFWPKIQRGVMAGLAEWYKQSLLDEQFAPVEATCITTP